MTRRFLIQVALVPSLLAPALFWPTLALTQSGPPQSARVEKPVVSAPSTWKIDPTHSELSFTIRHMVSKVRGQFDVWTGTITADPNDWSTATVEVVAQTSTINTNNERRDADLRSDNHFDADANPTVTFRSTKVTRFAGDSLTVVGNLTMHGIARPVVLTFPPEGCLVLSRDAVRDTTDVLAAAEAML